MKIHLQPPTFKLNPKKFFGSIEHSVFFLSVFVQKVRNFYSTYFIPFNFHKKNKSVTFFQKIKAILEIITLPSNSLSQQQRQWNKELLHWKLKSLILGTQPKIKFRDPEHVETSEYTETYSVGSTTSDMVCGKIGEKIVQPLLTRAIFTFNSQKEIIGATFPVKELEELKKEQDKKILNNEKIPQEEIIIIVRGYEQVCEFREKYVEGNLAGSSEVNLFTPPIQYKNLR